MLLSFPTRHCVAKNHASRWCTFRLPNGALSECRVHPVLRSAAGIRRASPRGLGRHGGRQRLRYGGVRPSTPSAPGRSSRRRDSLLPGARRAPPDRCAGGLSERVRGGPRPGRTAPSRAAARPHAAASREDAGRVGTAPTSHNGPIMRPFGPRVRGPHTWGLAGAQPRWNRTLSVPLALPGRGCRRVVPATPRRNTAAQPPCASAPGGRARWSRRPRRFVEAAVGTPGCRLQVFAGTPRAHVRRPSRGHAGCGGVGLSPLWAHGTPSRATRARSVTG